MKISSPSTTPLDSSRGSRGRSAARLSMGLICLALGVSVVWPVAMDAAGKPRFSVWKTKAKLETALTPPSEPSTARSNFSQAMDAESDSPSDGAESPESSDSTVKLNYYGANWGVVFKDLAEATNSRLVGNRVPTGRFTRRDSKTYSRSEAVRIINKEIEAKGFRIVEQDDLLVVLDIPSIRPRYQPAEIQTSLQRLNRDGRSSSTALGDPADDSPRKLPSRRPTGLQLANHESDEGVATESDDSRPPLALKEDDQRTVVVFRSRNRPVLDISRVIYQAYPQRAELLPSAVDNLPGFRVRQASAGPGRAVKFDIAIDEANEEVRVDVQKSQSASVTRLFRMLDVPKRERDSVRLMSETPAVCRIAAQLVPELEQLRQQRETHGRLPLQAAAGPEDTENWLAENDDDSAARVEAQAAEPDAPNPKTDETVMPLPKNLTDVIGNLKGEVTIESFEDLGALILKGAADDVEQVMQVIRQLEKLSEATAPQVHLLNLNHVDSSALAELLSTVFERLAKFPGKATQPRQNVAILPVSKPNAILIIAPLGDLDAIKDLADELDQPVDPLTEFQVFPLKTAIATQVEKLLTDFYQDRIGLDTRILIRADTRSNTVIIRARPRDLDEAAALIKKIDRDGSASVSQVQIFPLKNASAAELAAILNQAIQSVLAPPTMGGNNQQGGIGGGGGGGGGGGQIDEQFRDVKSTVLQFLAVDADGQRKLRSGLLADIRITPDARMNALVVAAPERSMLLITELIKNLDRPAAAVAEIKVFPLANADAQRVVTQLQSLFAPPGQQGGFNNQQRQTLGIQVVGAEDAGSSLIPLRFSVDSRTNSIIAIGGAEALGVVEAILYRLDEGDIRERQQAVYRLKNSPAAAIANAVSEFLSSQRDISRQDPNLVSSVEQLEREVIVVAEPVSNSLLISATPRYFTEIQKLVKKLDEAPAQVVIQALLVEVTLDNTDEFGIEFGFQNGVLFDRSVKDAPTTISTTTTAPNGTQTTSQQIISQTATPGFNFANPALAQGNNINASPSAMGLQGLSNFSLSRVNGDLGFGGLVLSAGSDTVNLLLRALSYSRRMQVLSRPQIRTLDNQTATILQGQIVPVVNGVNMSANGMANPQVIQQEAGIILTVTPRISPDGQIVMDLIAEKSAYRTTGVPIFTDAANGNVIESPIKDISTARAVVSVPNNQTVVIGGLITSSDERITRKVPYIGDMPILGYIFRYDSRATSRKELLIFLTPRLVREDADSELIKDVEMARMHFIEAEAEEMHGPLRGVPAEIPIMEGEMPWLSPQDAYSPVSPLPLPPTPMPPKAPVPDDVIPQGSGPSEDELLSPPPPAEPQAKSRRATAMIQQASYQTDRVATPKSNDAATARKSKSPVKNRPARIQN